MAVWERVAIKIPPSFDHMTKDPWRDTDTKQISISKVSIGLYQYFLSGLSLLYLEYNRFSPGLCQLTFDNGIYRPTNVVLSDVWRWHPARACAVDVDTCRAPPTRQHTKADGPAPDRMRYPAHAFVTTSSSVLTCRPSGRMGVDRPARTKWSMTTETVLAVAITQNIRICVQMFCFAFR